jgi:hypothetical protein
MASIAEILANPGAFKPDVVMKAAVKKFAGDFTKIKRYFTQKSGFKVRDADLKAWLALNTRHPKPKAKKAKAKKRKAKKKATTGLHKGWNLTYRKSAPTKKKKKKNPINAALDAMRKTAGLVPLGKAPKKAAKKSAKKSMKNDPFYQGLTAEGKRSLGIKALIGAEIGKQIRKRKHKKGKKTVAKKHSKRKSAKKTTKRKSSKKGLFGRKQLRTKGTWRGQFAGKIGDRVAMNPAFGGIGSIASGIGDFLGNPAFGLSAGGLVNTGVNGVVTAGGAVAGIFAAKYLRDYAVSKLVQKGQTTDTQRLIAGVATMVFGPALVRMVLPNKWGDAIASGLLTGAGLYTISNIKIGGKPVLPIGQAVNEMVGAYDSSEYGNQYKVGAYDSSEYGNQYDKGIGSYLNGPVPVDAQPIYVDGGDPTEMASDIGSNDHDDGVSESGW